MGIACICPTHPSRHHSCLHQHELYKHPRAHFHLICTLVFGVLEVGGERGDGTPYHRHHFEWFHWFERLAEYRPPVIWLFNLLLWNFSLDCGCFWQDFWIFCSRLGFFDFFYFTTSFCANEFLFSTCVFFWAYKYCRHTFDFYCCAYELQISAYEL